MAGAATVAIVPISESTVAGRGGGFLGWTRPVPALARQGKPVTHNGHQGCYSTITSAVANLSLGRLD
jgi:hypothetical protein